MAWKTWLSQSGCLLVLEILEVLEKSMNLKTVLEVLERSWNSVTGPGTFLDFIPFCCQNQMATVNVPVVFVF